MFAFKIFCCILSPAKSISRQRTMRQVKGVFCWKCWEAKSYETGWAPFYILVYIKVTKAQARKQWHKTRKALHFQFFWSDLMLKSWNPSRIIFWQIWHFPDLAAKNCPCHLLKFHLPISYSVILQKECVFTVYTQCLILHRVWF